MSVSHTVNSAAAGFRLSTRRLVRRARWGDVMVASWFHVRYQASLWYHATANSSKKQQTPFRIIRQKQEDKQSRGRCRKPPGKDLKSVARKSVGVRVPQRAPAGSDGSI